MCQAMLDKGEFDPELCPLLKGLSPEEIAVRLQQQPIASCRQRLADAKVVRNVSQEGERLDQCPFDDHAVA